MPFPGGVLPLTPPPIHAWNIGHTCGLLPLPSPSNILSHRKVPFQKMPPPHGKIVKKGPDLIGYDGVNSRVPGHNLKTNARPLGKLRVENATPRGRFYSRFHETLTTNVPNFVAKFARSLQSSEAHIGIYESL